MKSFLNKPIVKLICLLLVITILGETITEANPQLFSSLKNFKTVAVPSLFKPIDQIDHTKYLQIKLSMLINLMQETHKDIEDFKYKISIRNGHTLYIIDMENKQLSSNGLSWLIPCALKDDIKGQYLKWGVMDIACDSMKKTTVAYKEVAIPEEELSASDFSPVINTKEPNVKLAKGISIINGFVKFIKKPANIFIISVLIISIALAVCLSKYRQDLLSYTPYYVNTMIFFFLSEFCSQIYEKLSKSQEKLQWDKMFIVTVFCGGFFGIVWNLFYSAYQVIPVYDSFIGKAIRPYMDQTTGGVVSVLWPFLLLGFYERLRKGIFKGKNKMKIFFNEMINIWKEKKDNFFSAIIPCWLVWFWIQHWNLNRSIGSDDMVSSIAAFELPGAIFLILLANFKSSERDFGILPNLILGFGLGSFFGFFVVHMGILYSLLGIVQPSILMVQVFGLLGFSISYIISRKKSEVKSNESIDKQKEMVFENIDKTETVLVDKVSSKFDINDNMLQQIRLESLKSFENDPDKYPANELEALLRDLNDPSELVKSLIETFLSISFTENKKIVLALHDNIDGIETGDMAGLMRSIKRLKRKKGFKELLGNLIIIPSFDSVGDLNNQLTAQGVNLNKDKDIVFSFTPFDYKETIAGLDPNIRSVLVDKAGLFNSSHYYPLAEIILITLLKYHTGKSLKEIKEGFKGIDLSIQNIESIKDSEISAHLVFKLIPKSEKYPPNERINRYTRIKQLFIAA